MKIPKRVRKVALKEKRTLLARGVKLMEESGELAAEILRFNGEKSSKGRSKEEILDALHLEAIDCMLMAMDILVHTNATDKKIKKIMDSQLEKWEAGIKDRR